MVDSLEVCFRVSVRVEMPEEEKQISNFKRTTLNQARDVEWEREMTDGLNVSNNSAENIISQGRFACFAYT